jgi:hypothetical protein
MRTPAATITIRPAYGADELALARLADLDSADELPPAPLLLAEVDAQLRVALSLRNGAAIADPFFPTADLVALLRAHAAATALRPDRRWRHLRRVISAALLVFGSRRATPVVS